MHLLFGLDVKIEDSCNQPNKGPVVVVAPIFGSSTDVLDNGRPLFSWCSDTFIGTKRVEKVLDQSQGLLLMFYPQTARV